MEPLSQIPGSGGGVTLNARTSALRYFYVGIGVLSLFLVVIGFSQTYIVPMSAGKFSGPLLFHVHGAMYFAWILLTISQPLLIRLRNVQLHKKIGIAGFILASGMFLIGIAMAVVAGQRHVLAGEADEARAFLLIPLTDMVLFGIFIGMAVMNLKNSELHKRLIILATLCVLPAAHGRLFGMIGIDPEVAAGFVFAVLLTEVTLIIAVIYDLAVRRKIHPVYLWGGLSVVVIHIIRFPLGQTEFWKKIAEGIIG